MKSIIAYKPHLTARIITSVNLQILLVILLCQPQQDSFVFSLGILVIAILAMLPLCVRTSCLNFPAVVILGLLGLFPQFVILATLLHLMGWNAWLSRLVMILSG